MIIYEYIFERITEVFLGLGENDKLAEIVENYEENKDFDGLTKFIKKEIIEHFKFYKVNYLKSKNIQNTLYFYLNCMSFEDLVDYLERCLTSFDDFHCFTNALQSIYHSISQEIGKIESECCEYVLNTDLNPDIFSSREKLYNYMKQ